MSTITQWGSAFWSELGFAEADLPTGHAMRVRIGINTAAFSTELATQHHLTVIGRVDTSALSLGYGPAQIHPLRTTAVVDVTVATPSIRFSHPLRTTATVAVLTNLSQLRFTHHLRSIAALVTSASVDVLTTQHTLASRLMVATPAFATQLRFGHPLRTTARVETTAEAFASADIPFIGTVNLITNPIAEHSLEGWSVANGAIMVGIDTDHAWVGEHAVAAQFHNPALHEQLLVATPAALGLVTYPGSILWGQIELAVGEATTVTARVHTRVQYQDMTIGNGEGVDAIITASGIDAETWDKVYAPYLIVTTDLVVAQAWVIVEPVTSDAFPCTLFVGAAQIEYDPWMAGASAVIALEAA